MADSGFLNNSGRGEHGKNKERESETAEGRRAVKRRYREGETTGKRERERGTEREREREREREKERESWCWRDVNVGEENNSVCQNKKSGLDLHNRTRQIPTYKATHTQRENCFQTPSHGLAPCSPSM